MHRNILDKEKIALVVIDMQEAFRHSINEFEQIASRISLAIRGFQLLNLPVIVTEQYPKGLGRTAEELLFSLPPDFEFIEKTAFSSCGAKAFVDKLTELGARQILLCGIEAHVCVNQTAHDLLSLDYEVHLLEDCVSSRFRHDKKAALRKMKASGVTPSSVEMSLFELMRDSKHEQFKEVQNLIK
jgi:nicotinamidase-related amidase